MRRLLCYAHFDECGELKPFVRHAITTMQELCAEMLFVSNSPLSHSDVKYLQSICSNVIINDNRGYDFYMWKLALSTLDYTNYDEIILMNSSVFGPIFPLAPVFEIMENSKNDFWGITECFQIRPHIQSYFLVFRKQVIISPAFADFWLSILPYTNKNQIVMSYEVGLTQWLLDSGFRPDAYCNIFKLAAHAQHTRQRIRLKDNQTLKNPKMLLDIGCPFLKREITRTRPTELKPLAKILHSNNYPENLLTEATSENVIACPACGSKGSLLYKNIRDRINVFNSNKYDYFKCKNKTCETLWTNHSRQPIIGWSYTGDYRKSDDIEEPITPRKSNVALLFLRALNVIVKKLGILQARTSFELLTLNSITPGKLLAIDCNDTARLTKLTNLGWEINTLTADVIIQGGSQLQDQFDAIFLPDILSQRSDAQIFLTACHKALKSGGRLCLSTPNAHSSTHALFRKYWFGIEPLFHPTVFTLGAIKQLLNNVSFADIKAKTIPYQTEKYLLHSFDILSNEWTYLDSKPRLGQEIIPLLLQIIFIFWHIIFEKGDECQVIAIK
jgi:hypothetical protein